MSAHQAGFEPPTDLGEMSWVPDLRRSLTYLAGRLMGAMVLGSGEPLCVCACVCARARTHTRTHTQRLTAAQHHGTHQAARKVRERSAQVRNPRHLSQIRWWLEARLVSAHRGSVRPSAQVIRDRRVAVEAEVGGARLAEPTLAFGVWLGSKLRVSSRGGSRWKSVGVMEELNNNSVCL